MSAQKNYRPLVMLGIGALLVILIVRFVGARNTLHYLEQADWRLLFCALLAVALQALNWAIVYRDCLFFVGGRASLWDLYLLMWAAAALYRIVPSAGFAAMAVRFQFHRRHGMRPGRALLALALPEMFAHLGLITLLVSGLVWMFLLRDISSVSLTAAASGVAVVVLLTIVVVLLMRNRERATAVVHAVARAVLGSVGRLLKRDFYQVERVDRGIEEFYLGLRVLRLHRRQTWRPALFALLVWLSDVAALGFVFAALHQKVHLGVLTVACVLGLYAGAMFVFTNGLGAAEAMFIGILVTFGVPAEMASVAVVLYRFLAFWFPIPIGLIALRVLDKRFNLGDFAMVDFVDAVADSEIVVASEEDGDAPGVRTVEATAGIEQSAGESGPGCSIHGRRSAR